jgi:predicted RNA-binding Zn-ribbon protein involved in translation (DUF1610 family)
MKGETEAEAAWDSACFNARRAEVAEAQLAAARLDLAHEEALHVETAKYLQAMLDAADEAAAGDLVAGPALTFSDPRMQWEQLPARPHRGSLPWATHRGVLRLVPGLELECIQLSDGRRVISQESLAAFLAWLGSEGECEEEARPMNYHYLSCPNCGEDIFERTGPWWHEDETETCPTCGEVCRVRVDDDADVVWASRDNVVGDKG